ncbi:MAG: thermonuclease family protein [Paracoccaceae bacterium]|nr:thermonuclease family protein [Paracoccaceae bacterium]
MLQGVLASVLVLAAATAAAGPDGRVRVTDGDSLVVGGERVRLFGIDAHELDQSCWDRAGREIACGAWAKRAAARLFEGRRAQCRTLKFDRYDRALATCRIAGADAGETLLKAGIVAVYPRETLRDYLAFEKEAQVLGRGIWAWDSQRPLDFRAANRAPARPAPPPPGACVIKGNISGSGRIYHLPGQEHYSATRIDTGKGERWFCTEAEARAAGWRRARR